MFRFVRKSSKLKEQRSRASLGLVLSQCLFVHVSALSGISQVSLSSSVFGQVESSNFFGFFNLFLISLNFSLKLVNQDLHSFVVLSILIASKCQLLDMSLRLSQVLMSISKSSIFSIQLGVELADSAFHLVHGLLSSFKSVNLSFIQTLLNILNLAFKQFAVFLEAYC